MAVVSQTALAQALQAPAPQQTTQVDPIQAQQAQMMQGPDLSKLAGALQGVKWNGGTPEAPPQLNQMQAAAGADANPSMLRTAMPASMQQPYYMQPFGMGARI